MIRGMVGIDRVPSIRITAANRDWRAVVDTGFNGDLELPEALRSAVNPRYAGRIRSLLAGGRVVEEDAWLVEFPFDGEQLLLEATFVEGDEILLGTGVLEGRRLTIDFSARVVEIE